MNYKWHENNVTVSLVNNQDGFYHVISTEKKRLRGLGGSLQDKTEMFSGSWEYIEPGSRLSNFLTLFFNTFQTYNLLVNICRFFDKLCIIFPASLSNYLFNCDSPFNKDR